MVNAQILVGVLFLAWAAPAAAADLSGVVTPYLRIEAALAADSTKAVASDAAEIAAAAGKLGPQAAPIAKAATDLQAGRDLDAARAAFWRLSDALIAYSRTTGSPLGAGIRTAYCPMEKKYWVQKDGQIANPYAGKKMPTCGEFREPK
jgi:hypothetical protein